MRCCTSFIGRTLAISGTDEGNRSTQIYPSLSATIHHSHIRYHQVPALAHSPGSVHNRLRKDTMSLQLSTLLSTPYAPGFVYLHHPHTPSASAIPPPPAGGAHAQISAIEYNTARLLYTALLYRLAEASGGVWAAGEVRTWDGFARGLRTLWRDRAGRASGSGSGERGDGGRAKLSRKGKEKEVLPVPAPEVLEGGAQEGNWVVVITHAERLPRILGAQWAVLTRISELVSYVPRDDVPLVSGRLADS